jgi:hypothetical protein
VLFTAKRSLDASQHFASETRKYAKLNEVEPAKQAYCVA